MIGFRLSGKENNIIFHPVQTLNQKIYIISYLHVPGRPAGIKHISHTNDISFAGGKGLCRMTWVVVQKIGNLKNLFSGSLTDFLVFPVIHNI